MSDTTLEHLGAGTTHAVEFGRDALIVCDNLVRIYQTGTIEVQALQGLDLLVDAGEMIAVVGASGSGKSTLLAVLSGIDAPTAGRVRVGPCDLMAMTARERVRYRRAMVGFVWQQTARNLVPYLSAAAVGRSRTGASVGPRVMGSGLSGRRAVLSADRDVEGYVQLSDAGAVIRDHLLIDAGPSADVILHVSPLLPEAPVPLLLVAEELADNDGPRELTRARKLIGDWSSAHRGEVA